MRIAVGLRETPFASLSYTLSEVRFQRSFSPAVRGAAVGTRCGESGLLHGVGGGKAGFPAALSLIPCLYSLRRVRS